MASKVHSLKTINSPAVSFEKMPQAQKWGLQKQVANLRCMLSGT